MIRITSIYLVAALFCVQSRSISQCEWQVQWSGGDARLTGAIYFIDSLQGWVGRNPLGREAILRTTDGGQRWDSISFAFIPGTIASISFIDNLRGWCNATDLSNIYRSTDGGVTWEMLYSASNYRLFPSIIQFVDSLNGYGVGRDTTFNVTRVWKTIDGGKSWSSDTVAGTVYAQMQFFNAARGWIVGEGIYSTTDSGASWDRQPYPSSAGVLRGLSFISELEGWVCSKLEGWILHTTNGGSTWAQEAYLAPSPQSHSFSQIFFSDGLNGWLFGYSFYQGDLREEIFRTTDGGITWYQESIGLSAELVNGFAINGCHAWAIARSDATILNLDYPTGIDQPTLGLPEIIQVFQNYPNPFNPSTEIIYSLSRRERLTIRIYDTTGKVISTLIDEMKAPGSYSVMFNAGNLASGTYFFQLNTENATVVRKAVLIR